MITVLVTIWNFIKTAFSSVYLPITLSVIGIGLAVLYFNSQKNLKEEIELLKNN